MKTGQDGRAACFGRLNGYRTGVERRHVHIGPAGSGPNIKILKGVESGSLPVMTAITLDGQRPCEPTQATDYQKVPVCLDVSHFLNVVG